jgi:hypothetical protein
MTTISGTSRTSCAATASPDGLGLGGPAPTDSNHKDEQDRQLGQASWTQVPQARLRASCRGVTGWPHRPQRCPAARAALASHPAGSAATQLSPIGPEPVTGNPAPPGQKCSRCAWRTRSPIGTRSPPYSRAFRPARSSLATPGDPGRSPRLSRSATVIRSSLRVRACPIHFPWCDVDLRMYTSTDDDDFGDVAEILRRHGVTLRQSSRMLPAQA